MRCRTILLPLLVGLATVALLMLYPNSSQEDSQTASSAQNPYQQRLTYRPQSSSTSSSEQRARRVGVLGGADTDIVQPSQSTVLPPEFRGDQFTLVLARPSAFEGRYLINLLAHGLAVDGLPLPFSDRVSSSSGITPDISQQLVLEEGIDSVTAVLPVPATGLSVILTGDWIWPMIFELRRTESGITWWHKPKDFAGTDADNHARLVRLGLRVPEGAGEEALRPAAACWPMLNPETRKCSLTLLAMAELSPEFYDQFGSSLGRLKATLTLNWKMLGNDLPYWMPDELKDYNQPLQVDLVPWGRFEKHWPVPFAADCLVMTVEQSGTNLCLQESASCVISQPRDCVEFHVVAVGIYSLRVESQDGNPLSNVEATCSLEAPDETSHSEATHKALVYWTDAKTIEVAAAGFDAVDLSLPVIRVCNYLLVLCVLILG